VDVVERSVPTAQRLTEMGSAWVGHAYWRIRERREVDTRPLIRWLERRGKTTLLPRIVSFREQPDEQRARARLSHITYPGEQGLRVNRWGIAEPPPGEEVNPSIIDLVVVPAFGAGRNGHRIGHGFGYYDEFLGNVDAVKVALVYDACLVDHVPHEAHDVPMDVVVTENEVVRTAYM